MSRLQDSQYTRTFKKSVKKEPKTIDEEEKLISLFCPPLDRQLVQDIWKDTLDYDSCFDMLTIIAAEADSSGLDTAFCGLECDDIESDTDSEDENIGFLSTCFPSLPEDYLREILLLQANDVEKATDVLLNQGFIDEGDDTTEEEEKKMHPKQPNGKTPKKVQNKKKAIWTSGSLPVDRREVDNANESYLELATVPFNYWHQYDVSVRDIQRYFPRVSESIIASCVQRCRGNVTASVKTLMENAPEERPEHELPWKQSKDLQMIETQLSTIMEDRTPEEIHRVSVGTLIEYEGQSKDVDQLVNSAVEFMLTYNISQIALEERLNQIAVQADEVRKQARKKRIPIIPEYLHMHNGKDYVEDDPNDCRDIAMQLIIKRNELFHKAAESYRRTKNKGLGAGGVAFYYSDTAREYDNKAKEWNIRAARAAVRKQRISKNDDHLLDLHGLTVAEAKIVMKEGLTQWWSRSITQSSHKQIQPLKIITGVGNHSRYGEAKLLPAALKMLKEGQWLYEMTNPGMIYVKGVCK